MQLRKGIMLHNQLPDGNEAIKINSGTVFHKDQKTDPINYQGWSFTPLYEDDAYVTKRDWRELKHNEINFLQSNNKRKDFNTIYVGEIPDHVKDMFRQLDLTNSTSREEVMAKFGSSQEKVQALSKAMNEFLKPLSAGKPFHFHCIAANLPNLEMVACDITRLPANFTVPDKKYIGLHNDGTQFMTLHTTYKHGNRLTINLGNQTRAFFFVNLTMIQAVNMLKQKIDLKKKKVTVYNIAKHFFKHFPNYPVIKIIQKPYEYYIAPTDNCFHDGSTLGNTELDINIVYFGQFQC